MGNLRKTLKLFIQFLILGGCAILIILAFAKFFDSQSVQIKPTVLQPGYPFPSSAAAAPIQNGYPEPQLSQTPLVVATPTLNPYLFSSPADATSVAIGLRKTPSPSQIAADNRWKTQEAVVETQISFRKTQPQPTYQSPVYPVKTEADLPDVLYNDIGMFTSPGFDACLSAKNPASAFLVKSLNPDQPDYYILPFYKDAKVCALVLITVDHGLGTVHGVGGILWDRYPAVSSSEAVSLVEEKTGSKVIDPPVLSFRIISVAKSEFSPFWEVHTSDGQTYYVIFIVGNTENGPKKSVYIVNAKDEPYHP
jgi:hypothetical protein